MAPVTPRSLLTTLHAATPLAMVLCAGHALADPTSIGPNGCNVPAGLDGSGVTIGQVELGRAGRMGGLDIQGEWFWDTNGNNTYDPPVAGVGGEYFVDLDGNGAYTGAYNNFHVDVGGSVVSSVQVEYTNAGTETAVVAPLAPFLRGPAPTAGPLAVTFAEYDAGTAGPGARGPFGDRRDPALDFHATEVAGVMIARNRPATPGVRQSVAPGSSLNVGAFGSYTQANVAGSNANTRIGVVLATQAVIRQTPDFVRQVNHSYGGRYVPADGNSVSAAGLDYLSRRYDSLQVIAGDEQQRPAGQQQPTPGTPSDLFNGINVGMLRQVGGVYNRGDDGNIPFLPAAPGGRILTHLMAPGVAVNMPTANTAGVAGDAYTAADSGTSYAAPHVTGAAALLQQQRRNKVFDNVPRFNNAGSQAHQTMKAVLLNSADKIQDNGTFVLNGLNIPQGYLLGMQKTISADSMRNNLGNQTRPAMNDWTDASATANYDAFRRADTPLDYRVGAGALNVSRAVTQYDAGNFNPGEQVPYTAWSFNSITGQNATREYYFANPLPFESFVSITLCWDRVVRLTDNVGNNNLYDDGDAFDTSFALANLDLTLIRNIGGNWVDVSLLTGGNTANGKFTSASTVDSTEHLFTMIPDSGMYGIRVTQKSANLGAGFTSTDFGLAWWTVPAPSTTFLLAAGLAGAGRRRRRP